TSMNGQILRSNDRGDSFERFNLPFKVGGNMPGRSMGERLSIDPNQPSRLFLGARSGHGLWRSDASGATWSQVTSFPTAGAFVQDPCTESTSDIVGVVWVAFDPTSSSPGSPSRMLYAGVADTRPAIYQSTDAGATWAPVPGQPQASFLPHHGVLASNGILYV